MTPGVEEANRPRVSVVVIGYNDAEHLPIAVQSATTQSLRDIEVIVVDDGSTDRTPEVTARLAAADSRVRMIRLADNSGGCSRPRNAGLAEATGDYVMFLDSDLTCCTDEPPCGCSRASDDPTPTWCAAG